MTTRILVGDCRDMLRTLPADSIHMAVTSPPYFGLRSYSTQAQVWGGDKECAHNWQDASWRPDRYGAHDDDRMAGKQRSNSGALGHRGEVRDQETCACGAWRGELGQEPTPELFIGHLVEVFRDVRRVLRPDATLWVNIGDSYAGSWGAQSRRTTDSDEPSWHSSQIKNHPKRTSHTGSIRSAGVKPKDLYGIPWMLAFALRADGWYLRQDIVWSKPNPMPESVTDRCTKAHEYLFLLSKSDRYYYDAEAIKEASITNDPRRPYTSEGAWALDGRPEEQRHGGKPRAAGNKSHKYVDAYEASDTEEHRTKAGLMKVADVPWASRNRRSVWSIATAPCPDAHFATFPPALIEPCILAGSPRAGTVLDPFLGSGTTALVADRLGRGCVGIELNPEYAEMAQRRLMADGGLFAAVSGGAAA